MAGCERGWLAWSEFGWPQARETPLGNPALRDSGLRRVASNVVEQRRFVSHAEAARLMRRGGYSQEQIDQVLQELPDPFDMDSQHNEAVFLKHGITYGRAMDRMGGRP